MTSGKIYGKRDRETRDQIFHSLSPLHGKLLAVSTEAMIHTAADHEILRSMIAHASQETT